MSNTLKFGNGTWATKKGSTLAYNDENDNYKPLPFTTTRASGATRVNKEGLIEVVEGDRPRIDYTDSAKGALLLEPQRTNYSTNSELPSNWTYVKYGGGSNATITTGKTDMFGGTNAVQVDFPSNAENASLWFGSLTSGLSSGSETSSVYIKLVGSDTTDKIIQIRTGGNASEITLSGTEYIRYSASTTLSSNEAINLKIRPSQGTSIGGFSIIVCQPQSEQASYPTSYIPTQGASATRLADTASGSGNSEVFSDSSGVLFANMAANANDGINKFMSISDGTINNRINIVFDTSNNINARQSPGSVNISTSGVNILNSNKIAYEYQSGSQELWVNGFKIGTRSASTLPSGIDRLSFDSFNGGDIMYSKTKGIGYYNTALTDAELETLTSYSSLSELVTELNLNTL